MFTSARHTLPALDYVSIVRSVYGDRTAMLGGVFATAIVAGLGAVRTQSPALYLITAAFVIIGVARDMNLRAFRHAAIRNDDAAAAHHWEYRATWTGGALALVYGLWCLVAMGVVRDPFVELSSASIAIAVTVGVVARNFGLDRLVTIQVLLLIIPLSIGYALQGGLDHFVLATMLAVMLTSFRKLAGDIRSILLSAVHGRVEASRLAAELDAALTTLEHGLFMLDERGIVSLANERAKQLFADRGIQPVVGRHFKNVLAQLSRKGAVPATAIDRLNEMVSRHASGKVLLPFGAGQYFEASLSARATRSVLLFEDISERVAVEEKVSFMARHDALTGLHNRNYFGELAQTELQANVADGLATALMIIDIDDFKHVNDSHGHVFGDALLRQTAERLRSALPSNSVLARLGGDEFVVLCGFCAGEHTAGGLSKAVLKAFEAPFVLDEVTLSVKVSLGLVTTPRGGELNDLMTKADLALYTAKADGKGVGQIFHAQMDVDYHYRQRLKADLKTAVADGKLSLAFQPLLDITTRRIVSCEALARWEHPQLGPIPPATFIPMAEEMGLISDITAWVVESATRECSQWAGEVGVGVNVSARDFRGLDLPKTVDKALKASGLSPQRLEIEVTETAVIEEKELAHLVLSHLAKRGISIALDDFGTGYSSLSYLSALPFTKLKIDRAFVLDIATSARALTLLTNVARLGRDLDMVVVAEGVETEQQLDIMLKHTAIQQVQGYLFSRPLPARDIGELIHLLNGHGAKSPPQKALMVNRR